MKESGNLQHMSLTLTDSDSSFRNSKIVDSQSSSSGASMLLFNGDTGGCIDSRIEAV